MVMRSLCFIVLASWVLAACEVRIDGPPATTGQDLLVVEGMMTNENKNHLVKLSKPFTDLNAQARPVSGASVYVFEDTTVFALTEFPSGSGNYYTPVMRALFGKLYTLYIQHGGKTYFAQDSPAPVQPMGALEFRGSEQGF